MSGGSRKSSKKPRRPKRRRGTAPAPKPRPPRPEEPPSGIPIRLYIIVGMGVLLIGGAVLYRNLVRSDPMLRMPVVETGDVLPAVAKEIRIAQEAIVADPESPETWGEYGLVLFAHGFRKEAGVCFREAEQLDPNDYRWPYYLGMTMGVWDTDESLAAFERAVVNAPQRLTVRLRLAEWYFDLRKFDECEVQVRVALNQDARSPRAQLIMARLAFERGDDDEALRWAQQCADSPQGRRRDVHELLARIHQRLGNTEAAAAEVERAEQLPRGTVVWNDPEMGMAAQRMRDASVLNTQADLEMLRGNIERRIAKMRQVVESEPDNVLWKERLAEALIDAGQYAEAVKFLDNEALDRHPNSSVLIFLRGQAGFELDEIEKAHRLFQQAVSMKPDYDEAHAWLGRCLLAQGDPAGAMTAAREAIRLNPTNAEAHDFLGQAFLATDEFAPAVRYLQRAIQLDPQNLAVRIRLAETLLQTEQPEAAIQQLLEAKKADPDMPRIKQLLERAEQEKRKRQENDRNRK